MHQFTFISLLVCLVYKCVCFSVFDWLIVGLFVKYFQFSHIYIYIYICMYNIYTRSYTIAVICRMVRRSVRLVTHIHTWTVVTKYRITHFLIIWQRPIVKPRCLERSWLSFAPKQMPGKVVLSFTSRRWHTLRKLLVVHQQISSAAHKHVVRMGDEFG